MVCFEHSWAVTLTFPTWWEFENNANSSTALDAALYNKY